MPRINVYVILVWLLWLFSQFTNFSVESGEEAVRGERGIKIAHLIALILAVYLAKHLKSVRKLVCREILIVCFLVNGAVVSAVQLLYFDSLALFGKYLFAVLCFLLGLDMSIQIPKEKLLAILRWVSWIMLIAIVVKAVVYLPELRSPPTRDGWKPEIPTFYAGGVNIEASMIVLASTFFAGRKQLLLFLPITVALSALYLSRAAVAGAGLVFLLVQFNLFRLRLSHLVLALLSLAAIVVFLFLGNNEFFLSRFAGIGNDSSSSVRLDMLRQVTRAFSRFPFGYGAGNGIQAVEAGYGDFRAGNVHNVFAQVLLDFGIQGLVLWCGIVGKTILMCIRQQLACPFGLYLIAYFTLSCLQFTGIESTFWLILGVFIGYAHKKDGSMAWSNGASNDGY